ncbi:transposase [bacterium]|nr:transposase [bacterium]
MPPDFNDHKGFYKRWKLPHLDEPGLYQSITFRLVDSISPHRLQALREGLKPRHRKFFFERMDALLDCNYGKCWLKNPEIASIAEEALQRFENEKYELHAWVIMPNHIHCIVQLDRGYRLHDIVKGWKSRIACRANPVLGRTGKFWQADFFDRFIRDPQHLGNASEYIHYNPVAARLCKRIEDWQWSSIHKYMN